MEKTQSLETEIQNQEAVVEDMEELLKVERKKLAALEERRNDEIKALGDELVEISEDFMKATIEGRDGGYSGLKEYLSTISIRYSTGKDSDRHGKIMHYSPLFNPQRDDEMDRIVNKILEPSVYASKDRNFPRIEQLITNNGLFVDGTDFGHELVEDYFLMVFFFYLTKLHVEYEDAYRYAKHLFEEKTHLNVSDYKIKENLYNML